MKQLGRIKVIAPALLSLSLALQGCSSTKELEPIEPIKIETEAVEEIEEAIPEIEEIEIPIVDDSYIDNIDTSGLKLEGNIYDYFEIESQNLNYEGDEYYLTKDETDFIYLVAVNQPNIVGEKYTGTSEELINTIIENSYSKPKEHGTNIFETEYAEDARIALTNAVNSLLETAQNATLEDVNALKEVGLYVGDTAGFHGVTSWTFGITNQETRSIVFFPDAIQRLADAQNIPFEQAFEENLIHEFNHVRQSLSNEEREMGKTIFSFDYRDGVNTFLKESSAESELYMHDRASYSAYRTYVEEREAEAELMLLGLLKKDNTVDDYYNAVFDNDLEGLYKFYNLSGSDDIYKYYRIVYAMDARFRRNDFEKSYFGQSGATNYDLQTAVGFQYKQELFLLYTSKLIEYTIKYEDISLEECIFLFDIAKNSIVNDAFIGWFGQDDTYNQEFIEKINEYDNKFVEFIAEFYGKPVERIREMEETSIPEMITSINRFVNNDYTLETESDYKADYLYNKYPLLKAIMLGDKLTPDDYNDFMSHSNTK